jgi:hypothetical protein
MLLLISKEAIFSLNDFFSAAGAWIAMAGPISHIVTDVAAARVVGETFHMVCKHSAMVPAPPRIV